MINRKDNSHLATFLSSIIYYNPAAEGGVMVWLPLAAGTKISKGYKICVSFVTNK